MLNINGKTDPSYRYKMNPIKFTINGKGNGIFTIIHNLNDIGKSINHPENLLLKFLSTYFGSISNEEKCSITGSYTDVQLQNAIQIYINRFVLCPACCIPETIPILRKESKKNILLDLKCSACGKTSEVKTNNKTEDKIKDLIIKHIEKYDWQLSNKGNMVTSISALIPTFESSESSEQSLPGQIEDSINQDNSINPFD